MWERNQIHRNTYTNNKIGLHIPSAESKVKTVLLKASNYLNTTIVIKWQNALYYLSINSILKPELPKLINQASTHEYTQHLQRKSQNLYKEDFTHQKDRNDSNK